MSRRFSPAAPTSAVAPPLRQRLRSGRPARAAHRRGRLRARPRAAAILGWDRATRGALLLATLFSNAGNIGLPIALFAFGAPGLAIAGGWFAVQAISVHTLGVWIAAHAR